MRRWRPLPAERSELYCPFGLRLVDEFTANAPLAQVTPLLEIRIGGEWRALERKAVITPGMVLTYPGLGRRAEVVGQPPRRYRVKLEALHYRPGYQADRDGIELDAHPYNDTNPPAAPALVQDAFLLPSVGYPFAAHIPVLHGKVTDISGRPLADVLVEEGSRERVLSDERGAFSLPLRWVASDTLVSIDATDLRHGRGGSIDVTLPAALSQNYTIIVD